MSGQVSRGSAGEYQADERAAGISEAPANGIGSGGGVLCSRRNSKAKIVPLRCRARCKCRSSFGGFRLLAPEAGQDWRTLCPSD